MWVLVRTAPNPVVTLKASAEHFLSVSRASVAWFRQHERRLTRQPWPCRRERHRNGGSQV